MSLYILDTDTLSLSQRGHAAINAHIALVKAQIAANDAYRALDRPIPYLAFG